MIKKHTNKDEKQRKMSMEILIQNKAYNYANIISVLLC